MSEYRLLVVKLASDYASQPGCCQLHHLLFDVGTLLSMATIVPLFEAIESFMEFACLTLQLLNRDPCFDERCLEQTIEGSPPEMSTP